MTRISSVPAMVVLEKVKNLTELLIVPLNRDKEALDRILIQETGQASNLTIVEKKKDLTGKL